MRFHNKKTFPSIYTKGKKNVIHYKNKTKGKFEHAWKYEMANRKRREKDNLTLYERDTVLICTLKKKIFDHMKKENILNVKNDSPQRGKYLQAYNLYHVKEKFESSMKKEHIP